MRRTSTGQMSESSVSLYALCDPRTHEVRYIGRSIDPARRFRSHLRDRSVSHRTNWITNLRRAGYAPELLLIALIDAAYANAYEVALIRRARDLGWRLTNLTVGGEGQIILEPQKEAIRRANRARIWTPESRAKVSATISAVQRGTRHTPETIERMRIAQRRRYGK